MWLREKSDCSQGFVTYAIVKDGKTVSSNIIKDGSNL